MGNKTTNRRPVRELDVVRILATKADGSETCAVPQRYTLTDLQACVDNRAVSGTVDVLCAQCGESVADCFEIRDLLTGVPAEWSWAWKAAHG